MIRNSDGYSWKKENSLVVYWLYLLPLDVATKLRICFLDSMLSFNHRSMFTAHCSAFSVHVTAVSLCWRSSVVASSFATHFAFHYVRLLLSTFTVVFALFAFKNVQIIVCLQRVFFLEHVCKFAPSATLCILVVFFIFRKRRKSDQWQSRCRRACAAGAAQSTLHHFRL